MAVQDAQHTRKGAFPAEIEAAAEIAQLPNPLPLDYEPRDTTEFLACLKDPLWRICSGQLYKIMTKSDEHQEGSVVPFRPNRAQRRFLAKLHTRNVILKARQLGFTTLIAIYFLDHAIFNDDQRCGIIAHSLEDAGVIFRDKAKFAYDRLPQIVKDLYPLKNSNESEMLFHNNSAMRVAVSMRSGTIQRLHISEMGKIAAKFPQKAEEIVKGSLPAVPVDGIAIIESTAEGQEGKFFDIADRAEKRSHDPTPLGPKEFKFHFFPWFITPEYATDPRHVRIRPEQHEYFDKVEAEMGVRLKLPQRAWYVTTLENEQAGDSEGMWREYPSTPAECWMRGTEGIWFAPQLARARAEGRLCPIPHVSNVPVHTFWDIGSGDGTGIWAMQDVGTRHRFIRYFEDWAKGYSHYVKLLRDTGWLFGIHYLPHDATHERQLANTVAAPLSMLQELAPDWRFRIVPRVPDLTQGINMTREAFGQCWFNIDGSGEDCEAGIRHLDLYKKKWNSRLGVFTDEPEKLDGHTEAADSLRQYAQGYDPAHFNAPTAPKRRSRGAMTA
ncbi:terminase [Roseovarius nitratireducens]|uniref:terminase n=1 Tax=Roseovarius nitratireducens TaxID=2044597 RepID=UPI00101AD340|nr:terminase [Roseovarius nitratireducens]